MSYPNRLPPLGTATADDTAGVVGYLTRLADESRDRRDQFVVMADLNLQIYHYGTTSGLFDAEEININQIQNAIIATTDVQTKEPPRATLAPVETGEPGDFYWIGPAEIAAQLGLPAHNYSPWADSLNKINMPVMLDEFQGKAIQQMNPDFVVEIDDQLVAEVYQSVFDVYWQRSDTDRWIRQNLLTTNIQGWAWGLYEFDAGQKKHRLRNVSIKQVYIDPTVEDIADASYAGVDFVYDKDEALSLFPDLAESIEQSASEGLPERPDGQTAFSQQFEQDFKRPMVVLRVFWIRNQMVPVLADDGITQVGTRPALRQITVIGSNIVSDYECGHWDMPLLHNVNLPVINTPWGIGEPQRLLGLQNARNRMVRALVTHAEYYKAPMVTMSKGMHESLPEEYRYNYVRPGTTLVVPDDQWNASGGKVHVVSDPPPTPPSLVQLQGIIGSEIDKSSGHTEVLQGQASSQMSGIAIETLQNAATSVLGYKSQRTGNMVKRLARLMLHSIVNRLELEDFANIVRKYPRHVLQAIIDRGQKLDWDVTVEVTSGTNTTKARKKQEAMQEFQLGAITLQTLREKLGVDHRQEKQRQMAEAQQMAQMQPQQAQPGQQPPKTEQPK